MGTFRTFAHRPLRHYLRSTCLRLTSDSKRRLGRGWWVLHICVDIKLFTSRSSVFCTSCTWTSRVTRPERWDVGNDVFPFKCAEQYLTCLNCISYSQISVMHCLSWSPSQKHHTLTSFQVSRTIRSINYLQQRLRSYSACWYGVAYAIEGKEMVCLKVESR